MIDSKAKQQLIEEKRREEIEKKKLIEEKPKPQTRTATASSIATQLACQSTAAKKLEEKFKMPTVPITPHKIKAEFVKPPVHPHHDSNTTYDISDNIKQEKIYHPLNHVKVNSIKLLTSRQNITKLIQI